MKTSNLFLVIIGVLLFSDPNEASGQMYIKSDGRVSIGLETPAATDKLTVNQTTGNGIYANVSGTGATAILGYTSATTGTNYALKGTNESTEGAAAYCHANNNSGECAGVHGRADGNVYPASCGVVGQHFWGGIGVGAWSFSGDLIRGYSGDYPGGTLKFNVSNGGDVYANGRVGIGTATPEASDKLTVIQTTGRGIYTYVSGSDATAIYGYTSATSGTNYALRGIHESTEGAAALFHADNNTGACAAVHGRADGNTFPASCGVVGHHYYGGIGVGAWSYTGDLICGYSGDYPGGNLRFYVTNSGNVYADGTFNTFKKVLSPGEKKEYRTFNSIQATECWIEDIGSAELRDGEAIVSIDPIFAQIVDLQNGYKVFLTPVSEEMVCMIVTDKRADGFGVKGMTPDGRTVSCSFDYRIVAKDSEKRNARMEVVDIQEPIYVPREDQKGL